MDIARTYRAFEATMRLGCVVLAVSIVAATPHLAAETAVVAARCGDGAPDVEVGSVLVDELAARGAVVLPAADVGGRWRARFPAAPDSRIQRAVLDHQPTLVRGRNLYFDGDLEGAVEALTPWLEWLETDPSVLAFHPDVTALLFEAMAVLVRAHLALDDPASAERAMARLAGLLYFVEPSTRDQPPAFVEAWDARADLVETRALSIEAPAGCDVRINGVEADASAPIEAPAVELFARLRCDGVDGRVVRVPAAATSVRLSPALDAAIVPPGDEPLIAPPIGASPVPIAEIASAIASALDVDDVVVHTTCATASGEGAVVQLVRANNGSGAFTATRAGGDPPTPSDVRAAAAALDGLSTDPRVAIWSGDRWEGAPWAIGATVTRNGRPFTWALTAAAVSLWGTGAYLQSRVPGELDDVERCARFDWDCADSGELETRRDDARAAQTAATATWAAAGVVTVGALTAAWLESRRSRRGVDERVDGRAGLGVRWSSIRWAARPGGAWIGVNLLGGNAHR